MRRRISTLLLAVLMVVAYSVPALNADVEVYAASNPYPTTQDVDKDGLYEVPCTRFAWQCAYDRLGVALPSWGNAVNWWQNAINAGYPTGSTPKANSIAVWSGDTYGHVAYVTSGSGNTFTVDEGGRTDYDQTSSHGIVYGYTLTNAVGKSRPYDPGKTLLGFIYLDNSGSTEPTETYVDIGSDFYASLLYFYGLVRAMRDSGLNAKYSPEDMLSIGRNIYLTRDNYHSSDNRISEISDKDLEILSKLGVSFNY